MFKIKNNIATDVNEKVTMKEYVAYGSSTAVSRVYSAMSGFFGALVASTYLGLSEKAYQMQELLLEHALQIANGCHCENGCPSCVGPVIEVGEQGKADASALLKELLS